MRSHIHCVSNRPGVCGSEAPPQPRLKTRPISPRRQAPPRPVPSPCQAPPRPGRLSAPGHRPAPRSTSAFAHVVWWGFSPPCREWGWLGTCPSGPDRGGRGLPDFLGETGREGREDEGELRWSEVSLGVGCGRGWSAVGPRESQGSGGAGLGVRGPGEVRGQARAPPLLRRRMGVPSLRAAAGVLRRACGPWTLLLGRRPFG